MHVECRNRTKLDWREMQKALRCWTRPPWNPRNLNRSNETTYKKQAPAGHPSSAVEIGVVARCRLTTPRWRPSPLLQVLVLVQREKPFAANLFRRHQCRRPCTFVGTQIPARRQHSIRAYTVA